MENIDDLMRQKFDSDDPETRFEFREEYWEQAQALLEQDEARRSRRLWRLIGLVLALALLAWFLIARWGAGSLSQNKGGEQDLIGENGPRHETSLERPSPENAAHSIEVKSSDSGNTGHSSEESALNNAKAKSSERQASIKEKSLKNTVTKNAAMKPGNTGNTQGKYTQGSKNTVGGEALKSPSNLGTALQSQHDGKDETNPGDADNAPGKSTQNNSQSILLPNNQPPAPNNQSPIPQIPIFNIPIFNILLELPERVIVPRKLVVAKEPIAETTKPVQDKRFSFGLSLAGAAYQPSDTAGSWAGWTFGAYGKYRLNQTWSLMLGAQGRFVPGQGTATDSSNTNQVEQLRYSFGFRRETWKSETQGLYYLEIPLSAHWHKGPWGLEGGGAVGKLLSVQDRTEYTVESSLVAAKTELKKRIKGDTAPYNQTYFSAFAGASYRLNDGISLMARGQYRFTPVFKTAGEGAKNKGLGNLELGLRARLF